MAEWPSFRTRRRRRGRLRRLRRRSRLCPAAKSVWLTQWSGWSSGPIRFALPSLIAAIGDST